MNLGNKNVSLFFSSNAHAKILTATLLGFGVTGASAHPGHDLNTVPVTHLLTSPYHLLTLATIGGGLLLGASFVKQLAPRRAMQITGVAAVVMAAVVFASQLLN